MSVKASATERDRDEINEDSCKAILPGLAFSVEDTRPERYASNVDLEILKNCNLDCKYCYLDTDAASSREPSKRQLYHAIDEISEVGASSVVFTGGEPLLRQDFFDLVEYAVRQRALSVAIFTNGFFVTRTTADLLSRYAVRVCLKMDTVDQDVQDKLTGVAGSGAAVRKAVINLKQYGYGSELPLAIHACITRLNYRELNKLYDWAKSNGVLPHSSRFIPSGRGRVNRDHLLLSTEELRDTFLKIGNDASIPFPAPFGCVKMYKSCFVTSAGDVQPCSNVPLSAGNIHETGLREILQGSTFKLARNIRQHVKGKCRNCEYNQRCYGCRGLTYSLTGDWLGEDPLCWQI